MPNVEGSNPFARFHSKALWPPSALLGLSRRLPPGQPSWRACKPEIPLQVAMAQESWIPTRIASGIFVAPDDVMKHAYSLGQVRGQTLRQL